MLGSRSHWQPQHLMVVHLLFWMVSRMEVRMPPTSWSPLLSNGVKAQPRAGVNLGFGTKVEPLALLEHVTTLRGRTADPHRGLRVARAPTSAQNDRCRNCSRRPPIRR